MVETLSHALTHLNDPLLLLVRSIESATLPSLPSPPLLCPPAQPPALESESTTKTLGLAQPATLLRPLSFLCPSNAIMTGA